MENLQNEEKDKWTEYEDMTYQHKNKKSKQSRIESSSSSEIYGDPHKKNYQYTSPIMFPYYIYIVLIQIGR